MSTLNVLDNPFSDFEDIRHKVKSFTVDRLKQIISGLSLENNAQISKSGKKQDLIDRITDMLDTYRDTGMTEQYSRARAIMHRVRQTGFYSGPSLSTQPTTSGQPFSTNSASSQLYSLPRSSVSHSHSAIPRYDPYAPPRRPNINTPSAASTPDPPKTNISISVPIKFKSSPFYKVEQAASTVVECPESTGSHDRHTQSLQFTLTHDQAEKLKQPNSMYQLRLYCTTSTFYSPTPNGFRSNTSLCPIEFPPTCEVRVNGTLLQANLKGIKKKPGTAPPADLSKLVRPLASVANKIEMVYVNSQQNSQPKKFYLVVFLVEVTTVNQLVERLRKGKFRSAEDIKSQMIKQSNDDDDIILGKQKMTLKCPLSYTRISVPCRSDKCVHSQCFDAISWYSMMEQTTTWLCPVCDKQVNPEELIVDGYFGHILQQTPESVEEVEIEPDGEWHTADNKFGSQAWMDTHRFKVSVNQVKPVPHSTVEIPAHPSVSSSPRTDRASTGVSQLLNEVVILTDSDEEDETRVKRELSPTSPSSSFMSSRGNFTAPPSSSKVPLTVIDLTLDSDDEDAPAPAPTMPPVASSVPSLKRKSSSQIVRDCEISTSKKFRGDGFGDRHRSGFSGGYSESTHSPLRGWSSHRVQELYPPYAQSDTLPFASGNVFRSFDSANPDDYSLLLSI
ncbi:miz zinc finger [Pyrrhoderma noxium]|uniref:Miz zinc finger n=1 Tax=Pyrrhoderma noxium TaxID=2282107 RepID=A0A286UQX2_9AGAM|nr:miz zinc finger [Pyrrhoderma noxium]